MSRKAWLSEVPWGLVVWQNRQLCEAKHAHHGPTSDGHIVAGVAGEEEVRAFREFCDGLG